MSEPSSPLLGVLRSMVLPAFLIFVVPGFSLWFTARAIDGWDTEILDAIEADVLADGDLSDDGRAATLAFVRTTPASVACLGSNPDHANLRDAIGSTCGEYRQFDWARRASLAALLLGLFAAVVAGLSALAAFASRSLQYPSLVAGWGLLRVVSALQTLLQVGLITWLSYWVTALWFGIFIPKLILVAGLFGAYAVWEMMRSIFTRPAGPLPVDAEELLEKDAPHFWSHLRRLAERLQTDPPDHVLVGIDHNFFVTEGDVTVGETTLTGRTLYVSLSLLRKLERSEADAVLAHELGHLLGGDTGHGKRLAPHLARFHQYLATLGAGLLTLPIFFFMNAYHVLFQLALSKGRRQAELAADALAVEVTTSRALAHSLLKVAAYASFRYRLEAELLAAREQQSDWDLARRLAAGFADYTGSEHLRGDVEGDPVPHPFDSHPPLGERLAAVGEAHAIDELKTILRLECRTSWIESIPTAEAIEARLWSSHQELLMAHHSQTLALTLAPHGEAERAVVETHFPPLSFTGRVDEKSATRSDTGYVVNLDFASLRAPGLEADVGLDSVVDFKVADGVFKKVLEITVTLPGQAGAKAVRRIKLGELEEPDALVAAFERYLMRHRHAHGQQEARAAADDADAAQGSSAA